MHNDITFAEECLESISQEWLGSWHSVTILVSGSTDGTDQAVSSWVNARPANERPVLEVSETNLGPMGGLIRLLHISRSTHTAVLHGDDVLLPGFYSSLVHDTQSLDTQTVVVRDLTLLRPHIGGEWQTAEVMPRSLVLRSDRWNRYAMSVFNIAGMPGAVLPVDFCRHLLDKDELPPLLCAEDWYVFSRVLSQKGRLRRSNRACYGYRLHIDSTTHSPLQPYSVGFIRGKQRQQSSALLRFVSRLQAARERETFELVSEYDAGLTESLGEHQHGDSWLLDRSPWTSWPFLLSLWLANHLINRRDSWHLLRMTRGRKFPDGH